MNTGETIAAQEETLPTSGADPLPSQAALEQAAVLAPEPPVEGAMPASAPSKRYEFHQPALLGGRELRQLRIRHEEFARSVATRLSIYLRLEFACQVRQLETLSYRKFLESKPDFLKISDRC